jgi:hypothetical protein
VMGSLVGVDTSQLRNLTGCQACCLGLVHEVSVYAWAPGSCLGCQGFRRLGSQGMPEGFMQLQSIGAYTDGRLPVGFRVDAAAVDWWSSREGFCWC